MNFFKSLIQSQSFWLYTFLFSMVFVQLYFFPNILENKDIRINDLSYLLPPRVNVELQTTPIQIENINVKPETQQIISTEEKDNKVDKVTNIKLII